MSIIKRVVSIGAHSLDAELLGGPLMIKYAKEGAHCTFIHVTQGRLEDPNATDEEKNLYLKDLLKQNERIIRNQRKIAAAVTNAQIFLKIQKEYKSFSEYLWQFTDHKVIYETGKTSSELSDKISKDLKTRGMKFVGTTIIYSYLQAVGVIYSHEKDCFLWKEKS